MPRVRAGRSPQRGDAPALSGATMLRRARASAKSWVYPKLKGKRNETEMCFDEKGQEDVAVASVATGVVVHKNGEVLWD